MKVLIVEDEIRIREGIVKLLKKLDRGYEIVGEADNGMDGLTLLKEENPDIVITDIKMSHMDGLEMLTEMTKAGIHSKAIVLSAYSEFEYARQAMKLGITEYLLKPISLNDFSQALDNVEVQVKKDKLEKPDQIGTIEQIFRDFISGRMNIDKEVAKYLKHTYEIEDKQSFIITCMYLGSSYESHLERAKKKIQHAFSVYPDISYCLIDSAYKNSLIGIMYHYKDAHDLERWLQYQILNHVADHMTLGWTTVEGINQLKTGLDALYPYMDWNISFSEEVLISYPKITCVQTVPCIYPIELESKVKVAICAYDWVKVKAVISEFHCYFRDGRVYAPKEIKESYVRFLWAILGISKEIGCLDNQKLEYQKLLEIIMNAKMREELMEVSEYLLSIIKETKVVEDTTHLTVKRVISLIQEFYMTGITLDEIGSKLHITPEYLGTQFHKEMGITFSTYLKNFRINRAKELLCGTQLKLYEIADRVGYSDSKYFSKVFRDTTGQLPAEYRKTYK